MSLDLSNFIEALDENPFEEEPVDVRTFVRSKDFLGQPELSDIQYTLVETMSQIYRMEDLIRLMGDRAGREHHAKYTKSEVILQCGKGSGKDFTSTVGMAYLVYKLLCLKDPSGYFGKPTGDAIDLINIAINAQQAKNVFFKGFRLKIERSPWFAGKYEAKMDNIEFDKAVTVYSGHSERESHEGLNLMIAILDEISGFAHESASGNEGAKTADNIYKAFRASVDSRFPDYGKVVLLSFPRFKGDFISQRYEEVINEKEVIIRTHDFVMNEELGDQEGNKYTVEWDEDHIVSYKFPGMFAIKRPTWDVNPTRDIDDFKLAFYTDPGDALMRFACMPQYQSDAFFKQRDKLEQAMTLPNPVDKFKRIEPRWQPDADTTYFVHADLAQKHDKCAVAISHVEKWVEMKTFNDYTQVVPMVVTDMVAWWEPKIEGPVDLSEVKNWIISLRRTGLQLGRVTFDRWNSFDIQNELKSVGIKTDTLSVGKKHYEDMAMLIYEDRLVMPHLDLLLEELSELKIVSDKKVDHPRKKSKDLADAVCGSIYNAISLSQRKTNQMIEVHDISSMRKRNRDKEQYDPLFDSPDPNKPKDVWDTYLQGIGMM